MDNMNEIRLSAINKYAIWKQILELQHGIPSTNITDEHPKSNTSSVFKLSGPCNSCNGCSSCGTCST